MENLEKDIQKKILNFCKILPAHVDTWKRLLGEAEKAIPALSNYAEQLRHVERWVCIIGCPLIGRCVGINNFGMYRMTQYVCCKSDLLQ